MTNHIRSESVARLARSFAPRSWEALDARDTKAHEARRAVTTIMGHVLELMHRTEAVGTRQAYHIGLLIPGKDLSNPGRWVSPALSDLVRLGFLQKFSGPSYIVNQYLISEAGKAHVTATCEPVQATSPSP